MQSVTVDEPYPWFNMMVLASAVLASAVSLSGLFPYVGFMVVDLGEAKNEDEAGFYSGFIASGMMAGRFFSSVPWGRFADIYGRKPALISGCMSISAFSIMFGMSTSLVTAVIARFLLGLFNPVWGLAKALVSELVQPVYEARAMGMVTACWSLGLVVGSIIGGLLANPCELYPHLFSESSIFATFPYLLPNLATALLGSIGGIMVAVFLPETLPRRNCSTEISNSKLSSISRESENGATVCELLNTPGVVAAVVAYFVLSFVSITYDETVVLWAISSRDSGGLNMKQVYIGYLMSGSGAILLAYTLYWYPRIASYLGKLLGFKYGQLLFIPFMLALTCLPYLPRDLSTLEYILLLVLYSGGKGSCTLAFSSLGLIINQLVERQQRASLNGLVMAIGSASKMVGPFLGAWLYAWSISESAQSVPLVDYRFIFWILILSAACSAMVPIQLRSEVMPSTELTNVSYEVVNSDDDDSV